MLWKSILSVLVALLVFASPVAAANGTFGLFHAQQWGPPLSEAELGSMRGGYNGLAFSVFFTGFFDNLGNTAGNLVVNDGGATTPVPEPTFTAESGQVRMSAAVGDFGGARGIFQIAQVPGSYNVVYNNLFVQIAVINVMNGATAPSLSSLLGP